MQDMNEEEAIALAEKCIGELKQRFLMNQAKWTWKIVDKVSPPHKHNLLRTGSECWRSECEVNGTYD